MKRFAMISRLTLKQAMRLVHALFAFLSFEKNSSRNKYGLLVKPRKPFWQVLVETKDHFAHYLSHIDMHRRTYK
jgi:hypothetical protein